MTENNVKRRHLFYKKNKYNKPLNSNFEVAFSGLAKLFLIPGLTANQYVVQNENKIVGVASEDIVYTIDQNLEQDKRYFYTIYDGHSLQFQKQLIEKAENIPVYFFNKLQSNIFSKLYKLTKDGSVVFNMASLASVLTTSYTLEEDDLHKGNFGFYLIDNKGKIEVVFVKIDHDLMLIDSIMSRGGARFANLLYTDHAFAVTHRDLLKFPDLKDSGNHYWPTRTGFFVNHTSSQAYTFSERKASVLLSKDFVFQQAKWRSFLKHILLPATLIKQAVAQGFDEQTKDGQANIALVTNAVVARQARLRARLFSLSDFRNFIATISFEVEEQLVNEILIEQNEGANNHKEAIKQLIFSYKSLCQSSTFVENDTPLHAAIYLQNYRYDESWHDYGQYVNTLNASGQTPLDIAVEQFVVQQKQDDLIGDETQNKALIIHDLIKRGARPTLAYREIKEQLNQTDIFAWGKSYQDRSRISSNNDQLLNIFRELGVDCRLTLKMKKELSLQCLKQHINSSRLRGDDTLAQRLRDFKAALNGNHLQKPEPALQFIHQLRSRLWIVRQFRGLLGGSSTKVALNNLLNKELRRYSSNCGAIGFFDSDINFKNIDEHYDPLKVARLDGELDAKPCDHIGGFI